jgi:hypothetical protein
MKLAGLTSLFILCFYIVEFGLSSFLFPDRSGILDMETAGKTLYSVGPRQAAYGSLRLSNAEKKIVFVGESNVQLGFRPMQLVEFFPGVDIHNIAYGGMNMRERRQIVQLILSKVPEKDRGQLTIVMGIWYGSFVDDSRHWNGGPTSLEREMLRYGLYRDNDGNLPIARFNDALMPFATLLVKPFMLSSRFLLEERIAKTLNNMEYLNPQSNQVTRLDSKQDHEQAVANLKEKMGPLTAWSTEGFNTLYSIANEVSSSGSNFVLVDMPIPTWHRNGVPHDHVYQERLSLLLERIALLPRFSYASLREDFTDDSYYYDHAHPRPEMTIRWANKVAPIIKSVITQ